MTIVITGIGVTTGTTADRTGRVAARRAEEGAARTALVTGSIAVIAKGDTGNHAHIYILWRRKDSFGDGQHSSDSERGYR